MLVINYKIDQTFYCVAFSRSKRKTIIVGDRNTLMKNRFLAKSIDTVIQKEGFISRAKD